MIAYFFIVPQTFFFYSHMVASKRLKRKKKTCETFIILPSAFLTCMFPTPESDEKKNNNVYLLLIHSFGVSFYPTYINDDDDALCFSS